MKLKPSHFAKTFPFGSFFQNNEDETIAQNTMVIRAALWDQWSLTWEQYKDRRKSHGARHFTCTA